MAVTDPVVVYGRDYRFCVEWCRANDVDPRDAVLVVWGRSDKVLGLRNRLVFDASGVQLDWDVFYLRAVKGEL